MSSLLTFIFSQLILHCSHILEYALSLPLNPVSFLPLHNLCDMRLRSLSEGLTESHISMVRPGTSLFWKCEQNLILSVLFLSLFCYYVLRFLSFYLGSQCNLIRDHPGNSLIVLEFSCLLLFLLSYLFFFMADAVECFKSPAQFCLVIELLHQSICIPLFSFFFFPLNTLHF